MNVETGTDGVVPFTRIGTLELPGLGSLAAWRLRSYGGGIFVPSVTRLPAKRAEATEREDICWTQSKARSMGRGKPAPGKSSCWTSTLRTTRRAPTTKLGRARWLDQPTDWRQKYLWENFTWLAEQPTRAKNRERRNGGQYCQGRHDQAEERVSPPPLDQHVHAHQPVVP